MCAVMKQVSPPALTFMFAFSPLSLISGGKAHREILSS
jgi:hypothetical protein